MTRDRMIRRLQHQALTALIIALFGAATAAYITVEVSGLILDIWN